MKLPRSVRWIVGVTAFVALVWYVAAYLILPRRYQDGGVRVNKIRQFDLDWEAYVFVPAGFAESLVLRTGRLLRSHGISGEAVLVRAWKVKFRFRVAPDPKPLDAPLPDDVDILEFAAKHPPYPGGYSAPKKVDGTTVRCAYWDCDVDDAVAFLRGKYPRPYTVTKVLRWYDEACDEATRIHSLHVLAATRNPRAGLVLATALRSPNPNVRMATVSAFNYEFGADQCAMAGDRASEFQNADEWLEENYARLWREARHLALN